MNTLDDENPMYLLFLAVSCRPYNQKGYSRFMLIGGGIAVGPRSKFLHEILRVTTIMRKSGYEHE